MAYTHVPDNIRTEGANIPNSFSQSFVPLFIYIGTDILYTRFSLFDEPSDMVTLFTYIKTFTHMVTVTAIMTSQPTLLIL